ncbi:MAG: hypothetical protein ACT4P6_15985 [Gemmatimonadaceae bacterium]
MRRVLRCAAIVALAPAALLSQTSSESRVRTELRADAIFARVNHAHAGLGISIRTGYNIRAHVTAAGGIAFRNAENESSARGDATLRLLLDPFGETRTGLSIGGGVSVLYDGFEKTRPVGLLVLGLEGSPRTAIVWGVEVALGGGARIGLVLRRRAGRYR